jgi:hypothetical protein
MSGLFSFRVKKVDLGLWAFPLLFFSPRDRIRIAPSVHALF